MLYHFESKEIRSLICAVPEQNLLNLFCFSFCVDDSCFCLFCVSKSPHLDPTTRSTRAPGRAECRPWQQKIQPWQTTPNVRPISTPGEHTSLSGQHSTHTLIPANKSICLCASMRWDALSEGKWQHEIFGYEWKTMQSRCVKISVIYYFRFWGFGDCSIAVSVQLLQKIKMHTLSTMHSLHILG